jgi:hypothetical protein
VSIIVRDKGTTSFQPAPTGVHTGVCVDVIDLGMKDTQWGPKHKIRLVWQIEELMENGKPFLVSKQYTASLNEKANLRKDLESWRGRPFTQKECEGFDVETIVGVNCLLNVQQEVKGENTWANIKGVMPLKKGIDPIHVTNYIRVKDRDPNQVEDHTAAVDEDSIPF